MPESETFELIDAYDNSKNPRVFKVRYMTFAEAINLRPGHRVYFEALFNRMRCAKVNGKPKTWKTRNRDCDVPLKYGLYCYLKAQYRDGQMYGTRIVVPVE